MKSNYIRRALEEGRYEVSSHALDMMIERDIGLIDIRNAANWGQVLEVNPNAKPFPTTLMSGPMKISGDDLHVVFSKPPGEDVVTIVTVYFPHEALWHKARVRRGRKQ